MGSAIKGRSRERWRERQRVGRGKKKASNRAMHEREECFHKLDMGWLWVLSDIDHSARREVAYSTKSL